MYSRLLQSLSAHSYILWSVDSGLSMVPSAIQHTTGNYQINLCFAKLHGTNKGVCHAKIYSIEC